MNIYDYCFLCYLTICFLCLCCKSKFVVDDGDKKKIISILEKKWKDGKSRLFTKHYKWELTLEENLKNRPSFIDLYPWAVFVNYRRKPEQVVNYGFICLFLKLLTEACIKILVSINAGDCTNKCKKSIKEKNPSYTIN